MNIEILIIVGLVSFGIIYTLWYIVQMTNSLEAGIKETNLLIQEVKDKIRSMDDD